MNEPQKIIILGTRVFAEEVADLLSECEGYELSLFCENWERARCDQTLLERPIVWVDDLARYAKTHKALCAIGTTKRSLFTEPVENMGFQFATLQHPTCRVSPTCKIGAGTILSVGSIVASHTTLGRHVIVNRGCLIGHHTNIADYVTISPGANIAGRVTIGEASYIGMGAIILNDLKVGSHSIVGAGAVVTKDVPDNVQVMGVPAKIVKENISGR